MIIPFPLVGLFCRPNRLPTYRGWFFASRGTEKVGARLRPAFPSIPTLFYQSPASHSPLWLRSGVGGCDAALDLLSDQEEGQAVIIGPLVLSHWLLDLLVRVPEPADLRSFSDSRLPLAGNQPYLVSDHHRTDVFAGGPSLLHFFPPNLLQTKPATGVMVAGWFRSAVIHPHESFWSGPTSPLSLRCLGSGFFAMVTRILG